jgi:type IV pilus assembly protein PilY1
VALGNDVIETLNGSDINNAIPTSPLVITPDTASGIPWRGAMVYINDREGKITKINLTDSTVNDAKLFDQTTLFTLNANTTNKRYTFFSMDAGVGVTTKDFWLFGGTGDFNQLGDKGQFMDNILYGIRDFDFPNFKHLNGVVVPSYNDESFTLIAHQGANNARSIDDADVCSDVTGDTDGSSCPDSESAWVIHLDDQINNTYRKASAPPTLFKGQVYFPVYEPAPGSNRCNIGNAYICAADDECGTNNSHKLVKGSEANGKNCTFVREGVLSELVIFGDKLFGNVAGPSDNENTLYSILALAGEVLSNKGGWRDVGF